MRSRTPLLALTVLLAIAAVASAFAAQRAPADATAPAGTPGPGLPDLVITGMRIELETGGSCAFTSTQLGLRIEVQNIGEGDAGPFVLYLRGKAQTIDGLAAGASVSRWFAGHSGPGELRAIVDDTADVDESDENNNQHTKTLPIPTLPATCTPTATLTPTPLPPAGDADCTGSVDARDAALILQFGAGLLAALQCQIFSDVNGDGGIDARDAALVLQYVAGLIDGL